MTALWQAARAVAKRTTPLTRKPLAPVGTPKPVNEPKIALSIGNTCSCGCGYHVCSRTGPCAPPKPPENPYNFPVQVAYEHGYGKDAVDWHEARNNYMRERFG